MKLSQILAAFVVGAFSRGVHGSGTKSFHILVYPGWSLERRIESSSGFPFRSHNHRNGKCENRRSRRSRRQRIRKLSTRLSWNERLRCGSRLPADSYRGDNEMLQQRSIAVLRCQPELRALRLLPIVPASTAELSGQQQQPEQPRQAQRSLRQKLDPGNVLQEARRISFRGSNRIQKWVCDQLGHVKNFQLVFLRLAIIISSERIRIIQPQQQRKKINVVQRFFTCSN